MIKKNTKIIFDDDGINTSDDLVGGMPLSRGDIVHMHRFGKNKVDYEVVEKTIDCYMDSENQNINITYKLKKI